MTHICADISDPAGFTPPAWVDTVQGYIGERVPIRTPTPHIWTRAEWAKYRTLKKYPVFVGTPAVGESGNAETEAFEAMESLYTIGCGPGHVVGLDMETAVDGRYVAAFAKVLNSFRYLVWVYGSASTVFGNPAANGYDAADWTGHQHYYPHPEVRATQYADSAQSGIGADLRLIRPWQWRTHLWR